MNAYVTRSINGHGGWYAVGLVFEPGPYDAEIRLVDGFPVQVWDNTGTGRYSGTPDVMDALLERWFERGETVWTRSGPM